ncbi:Uncharacterised protein [Raoultella terrigena]|uniref:Fimbrial protein TcfA n=1 Tax=Raoultella terrigena TaxID=577 RepID=A0A485AZA1_RAOTE|nr:Uncharacterised protein [Raoultella terrigena]
MKNHILAIGLCFCAIMPARALDVGDISSFMNSDSSVLSKEIKNTTDSGRLINIHMERLSSPLDGGNVIAMESQDEVLLTPASLLLPAKSSDVIRFFYKGPTDDKERYYRIVWFDQALSDAQRNGAARSAVATASARIGTILGRGAPQGELPLSVRQRHAGEQRKRHAAAFSPTAHASRRRMAKSVKKIITSCPVKSADSRASTLPIKKDGSRSGQGEQFVPVK